ncbi:nickel-binding protein [Streptomyces sp. NPDC013157]|uniref:nickel-binding protein n=1 Tax=unclassified Streptomyces TaxID=2593676 RepID=UPI0036AB80AD
MPLYLSLHQAPGLSEEEIAGNAPEVAQQVHATFRHLYVNTDTGFIVTVYEAENAKAVEAEFERVGFPFDAIHEIDFSQSAAELAQMVGKA